MPPTDPKANPHPTGTSGKRRGASQDVYSVSHVNEDVVDILDETIEEAMTPPSPWPAIGSAIPNVVIVLKVLASSVRDGQLEIKGWDVALFVGCMFAAIMIVTNYSVARGKRNRLGLLAKKKVLKLRDALASLEAAGGDVTTRVRVNAAEADTENGSEDAPEIGKINA